MTCRYQTRVPCTYQRPPNSEHRGYYCLIGAECPFGQGDGTPSGAQYEALLAENKRLLADLREQGIKINRLEDSVGALETMEALLQNRIERIRDGSLCVLCETGPCDEATRARCIQAHEDAGTVWPSGSSFPLTPPDPSVTER